MNWFRFWTDPPPAIEPIGDPPEDKRQLAIAAKTLLEDPVFSLAIDRVQKRLIETWRLSAMRNTEEREAAYHLHAAIEELRVELRRMTNPTT